MGAIFNEPGGYHSFEVDSTGVLMERHDHDQMSTPRDAVTGNPAVGFKPNTPITVRRLTNNKGEIIYPGSFFLEGLAANGDDIIEWDWSNGWHGPYGG